MADETGRRAWVAWDVEHPDEGVALLVLLAACGEAAALARACERFGYTIEDCARHHAAPQEFVAVARVPELDGMIVPGQEFEESDAQLAVAWMVREAVGRGERAAVPAGEVARG